MRYPTMLSATLGLIALGAVAGCAEAPAALDPAHQHATPAFDRASAEQGRHEGETMSPEVRRWLAQLRRTTARFHRFEEAAGAGYGTQITPCMALDGAGAMGFHYGNPALIDGLVEPLRPELLLFEPQKNGKLRFVAVEYVVPYAAWTAAEPPSVSGIPFHRNDTFQLWVHHAWIAADNPAGIFADWNPRVSCQHAD